MSEAFFDSVYSGGADYYGLEARPEFHSFVRALPGPKPKCLDLACGQGRHAIPAARIGARVHAVDYSCVAIDQLRAFASDTRLAIEAECADVRTLNPPAQAYDAVFLVSTLSHFDEPDLQPIVDMAKRALAEGGRIFVEAFTTADPGYRGSGEASETASALKHYFAPNALADLFRQFTVTEYREFMEDDLSHGPVHQHGVALLIAEKR